MADDKRKKKRGRKSKLNLTSCFPYSYSNSNNNKSNDGDLKIGKLISGNSNKITDVEFVNKDISDRDASSHKTTISRLFKSVFFFAYFSAKKKIDRSASKSSVASDASELSTSLSTEKTMKSQHNNNASRVTESTDVYSSFISCSRTTSSSNLSSSRCSSSNSNSQWSSEQKTTPSSRIESSVESKPNPIISISRSDSLPKPNKTISSKTLVSSNSLPIPKPNPNHNPNPNHYHNLNKTKSSGNNRNNLLWCLFLLLSLVVLVVYGRIYSILCTSTWFYFVPCRKMKRVKSVTSMAKVVDTDSEQYKKRVIMAGLLDRTRNPLR